MKYLLYIIYVLVLSYSLSSFGNANDTCTEIYQRQRSFFGMHNAFKDEIAFIDALKKDYPFSEPIYQKYCSLLASLTIPLKQTISLLRIGFNEQIFCNPWPLRLPDIVEKLKNGEFTHSLERELAQVKEKFSLADYALLEEKLRVLPSPFPKEVNIRTHTEDFTGNFFYYLRKEDGKIFVKVNPRKGNKANILKSGVMEHYPVGQKLGNRTEWNLFNGDGGPLLTNRKIVEMSVAGEIVVAVDDSGKVHLFKPTDYKLPTQWKTSIGCPFTEELSLPREKTAWTFSVSLKVKPEERRSREFMHPDDIVFYYEDADGKKIEFGFTATVYVLSKDGRKVYYWDTGLPASFSRAFTTPHRGNFIARNISAQGSTIMIIGVNEQGEVEIYTRMFDYETNGACPGELHTYLLTACPYPDQVLGLLEARRKLPLPGWVKMVKIPLSKGDVVTTRISIELTGQGNSARLLKVVGTKNGVYGYYQKMIDAQEWDFVASDELGEDIFNDIPLPDLGPKTTRHDMDYKGISLTSDEIVKALEFKLKNFHYFLAPDEPALLEVRNKKGEHLLLNLHINDAYTFISQQKTREESLGAKDGEPKALLGTLIIPEQYLKQDEPRSLLQLFEPFHMKTNAFELMANEEKIILKSIQKFIDFDDDFKMKKLPDITLQFRRISSDMGYYERLIFDSYYLLYDMGDVNNIKEIVRRNEELLIVLENDRKELAFERARNKVLGSSANAAFNLGKNTFHFIDRTVVHSLRKFLPRSNLQQYFARDATDKAIESAGEVVRKRIRSYRAVLK